MTQAITTKYSGPSSTQPGRIIAKCNSKRMVVYYDHGFDTERNHHRAAMKLATEMGWKGSWCVGVLPDGVTNVYVSNGHNAGFAPFVVEV
jgi:hypothetical protein